MCNFLHFDKVCISISHGQLCSSFLRQAAPHSLLDSKDNRLLPGRILPGLRAGMTMVPPSNLQQQKQQQQQQHGYLAGACGITNLHDSNTLLSFGGVRFGDQQPGYDHHLYYNNATTTTATYCLATSVSNNMADEEDSATNSTTNETGSTSNTPSFQKDHYPRPHPPNEDAGEGASWLRLGIGSGSRSTPTAPSPSHNNNNNDDESSDLIRPPPSSLMLELNLLPGGAASTTTTGHVLLHQQQQAAVARASMPLIPPPPPPTTTFLARPSGGGPGGPSVPILFYHHQLQQQHADQQHQLGWANYLSRSQAATNPRLLAVASSSSSPSSSSSSLMHSAAATPYFLQPRPSPLHPAGLGVAGTAPPIPDVIRPIDPPRRPHSGIWFMLQASINQPKEPFLPQLPRSYLRIKDGRMTVRLLIKYLVNKLGLESESEVEIRCRGRQLEPNLTMQQVRDEIWSGRVGGGDGGGGHQLMACLPQSSTVDHVMLLHYSRSS